MLPAAQGGAAQGESARYDALDHRHPPRRGTTRANNAPLILVRRRFQAGQDQPDAPWSDEVMEDYIDTNGVPSILLSTKAIRRSVAHVHGQTRTDPTSAVAVGLAAPRQNVGCNA